MSFTNSSNAQDELPFRVIPESPASYTAENVAARMIDGLGFRYYWATEGLRPEDLEYRPGEEARSSYETLQHIYGLTRTIRNAVMQTPNTRDANPAPGDYGTLRSETLAMLWAASERLKSGEVTLEECPIVFQRGGSLSESPFWNNINGPIADALWHCGQVVSLRRASGNPFNSKVNLFSGTVRE